LTALPLLLELEECGITIEPREGNIYASPREALTPELRERIKAAKPALIAHLQERQLEEMRKADELDRLALLDREPITPAQFLINRCQQLRIALRLDADGRLAFGRSDMHGEEPGISLSLAQALTAHADAIAELLRANGATSTEQTADVAAGDSNEVVMLVYDSDRLFKTGPKFGYCACRQPATFIVNSKSFCTNCVPRSE
jgi:hypothetical protein